MAITPPSSQPTISQFTGVPNSATDTPAEFDTKANQTVQEWVTNIDQQNSLASWFNNTAVQVYDNATSAFTSASEALLSEQLAAASSNYQGEWSTLTGSKSLGIGVTHNDGLYRLKVNLADVTASEPNLDLNPDWQLILKRGTDLDAEQGNTYVNLDANQVKNKLIQRKWEDLTLGKNYNESCFYRGKEYVVRNPISDDQIDIAPPTSAGRSYLIPDGIDDYIDLSLPCLSGDILKAKFTAPLVKSTQSLIDGVLFELDADGTYNFGTGYTVKVDGQTVTTSSFYPIDGLDHSIEIAITSTISVSRVFANSTPSNYSKSKVYDLEQLRVGEPIHCYPLRTDAVDYLAGNLIKDEEFTYSKNFNINNGNPVFNNGLEVNGPLNIYSPFSESVLGTFLVTYEIENYTSGSIYAYSDNAVNLTPRSANGYYSEVMVQSFGANGAGLFSSNFVGTIKNFRVIKLNELSPSADFSDASGFATSGGVTITGGQAVFGSGAGFKSVSFPLSAGNSGKRFRVVYSVTGTTTGTFRATFSGSIDLDLNSIDGIYDQTVELPSDSTAFSINTGNGWDGNVEYMSVTEVTDGTVNGSIDKNFDRYWQLTNGEQSIEKSAGVIRFNDVPLSINTSNTLKIAPLSTANLRDEIVLTRAGDNEPVIELDASDIAAGRRITHPKSQPDTSITLNTNDTVRLIFNGQDLEVYRG